VLNAILASTVVAAVVAALVAILTAERRIATENVTQERAKWRKDVKDIALEVHNAIASREEAKLRELRTKFALNLNPHDREDIGILNTIALPEAAHDMHKEFAEEFVVRVALLLKHDWERAKYEASMWRWLLRTSPERVRYDDFVQHREVGMYGDWRWLIRPLAAFLRSRGE
jgi:hypothetical protein